MLGDVQQIDRNGRKPKETAQPSEDAAALAQSTSRYSVRWAASLITHDLSVSRVSVSAYQLSNWLVRILRYGNASCLRASPSRRSSVPDRKRSRLLSR